MQRSLVLLLALVLALGACAGGRTVVPVAMEPPPGRIPERASEFVTHEQAVRGVAAIMTRDLRLPVPDRVTVYV